MKSKSEQAANEILEGFSPAQIGVRWGVPTAEVIQTLFVAIGEGRIRQSDLLFSLLDKDERTIADNLMSVNEDLTPTFLQQCLGKSHQNYDLEEVKLYLRFRKSGLHIGDMYADILALERGLHQTIRSVLMRKFGEEESKWWGTGVPESVRTACAQSREFERDYENHSYSFTTFLHLWKILDKNWNLFSSHLPPSLSEKRKLDKQEPRARLEKKFVRLNSIRNQLMHPVREALPTEDDYKFVNQMRSQLDPSLWQKSRA